MFQVRRDPRPEETTDAALCAARAFFRLPLGLKHCCVDDLSYSGYVESGEERTAGLPDQPEIFTVTGPVPWPGELGERILRLVALALGLGLGAPGARQLTGLTRGAMTGCW
ncbi:hypothetical protein M4D82_02040 [Streptomyces sp. RerS4]|nr:hypothetical protein M4D82_02040 [Streptomyces sp. RerS4]